MNPLVTAEQAVLGAVLLDPGQLSYLDWLAPDHFSRPVHRALFAALRTLRDDGHPALDEQPVPLSWVTDAVAEADRHVRGLASSYAHTLIQSCPRPAHAPVYGRMVLEGAIHRTITENAVRLHQAARADALRGDVEEALHHADVLTGVLGDLARRWGTEPHPVAPATPSATTPVAPPVRADRAAEDERFLLAVLVEQPNAMDEVVDWLRPGDFTDPTHGQLYRCLGALHHRGEPIDRITLLWEAQRRGLLADGTLSGDQLTTLCDSGSSGSAEWLGEQVMRSSVTRTAATSARAVRALAENEALAPGRLINHALHALAPLDDVRTRWRSANNRSAPAAPEATSSNRPPPPAQVHAALARSTPSRGPGPGSASHLARPPYDRPLAAKAAPFRPHRSSSP
ncbi:DnaB-like helicase N-terminal domain-containing protein [Streptomyces catenulae]|uniref:DnaB-like helicase N-terminal domain-containing protein n=1 Tax=Streptomyces catenulae TaxID=66875 RepID=A0ABV2Z2G0_9ACTN|nr:DnaB-like helicase N-terminal domain-containing protein [Streptomyces catenulae]